MDLTPENFRRLLNWLHPNDEEAGQEYERIRTLLVRKFSSHGCSSPDRLADKTLDRAAEKLTPEKIEKWTGKKERYFYRVSYYILLEDKASGKEEELSDNLNIIEYDRDEDLEPALECLEKCLQQLSTLNRELITRYYRGKGGAKIENRKKLAIDLNLELPVLRVKALRIRRGLKICIENCLKRRPAFEG